MLGIHYEAPILAALGSAVVPFETTEQSAPLCCNLQLSNLSRVVDGVIADEDLHFGYVLYGNIISTKKLPSLSSEAIPIPE